MNKSLAERIAEHTRQVTEAIEKEQREKTKAIMLEILKNQILNKAKNGKKLFRHSGKSELDIELISTDNGMKIEDMTNAITDIGFEIHEYPMCYVLAIPEENVSKEIQKLLEMYEQTLKTFASEEEKTAKADCRAVVKKLEKGEYEVTGINAVTVKLNPKSDSQLYNECVRKTMNAKGFDVNLINPLSGEWYISVIQKEGD